MNKIALIVAVAGVAAFTGSAFAQGSAADTSPGAGAPTFNTADTNKDGFIDFSEAAAAYPG